ncbi:9935_t:CDS:1, partial [Gigaspora rosea]
SYLQQTIPLTNSYYDFGEFNGWFNNWESRDSYANASGISGHRFSVSGQTNGIWYCCEKKKPSLMANKSALDHLITAIPFTNTYYDFGEFVGWFNSWEARDGYASNMYDHRFSMARQTSGKWYCCMKPDAFK